ncbi:MAG: DNA repair protein RadA [Chloroflexota bacterium]|nr:DNA repair protein RadA [Chloroflexota bacterium]
MENLTRRQIGSAEFDRVLGGGVVPGSITLIGGDPGIGKCVAAGTLISTENGLVPIETLNPACAEHKLSEYVVGVQSLDGLRHTSHFYDSGIQPTCTLTTRMGYSLQATLQHPVLTINPSGCREWKTLSNLQEGDYVAIQRHGATWGTKTDLSKLELKPGRNGILPQLPTTIDTEFAYIIGLLIGDGYIDSTVSIGITTNDQEIKGALQRWAERLGVTLSEIAKHGTTATNCRISNKILVQWLYDLGYPKALAHHKRIPDFILTSTCENVRACLQGLFDTDGSADKLFVEYCSVSKTLARQVHLLLLQFGVIAKLRFRPNKHQGSWVVHMQGDNARLFYERIGFRLTRKQEKRALLPQTTNSNLDVVPFLPVVDTAAIPNSDRRLRRYFRGERRASYPMLQRIAKFVPEVAELLKPAYFWDEVVAVEDSGLAHCYDLCVPETHSFVANGIVSHNSTIILQSSAALANTAGRVLYVSGEESTHQIKMRADRMGLAAAELYLLTETNLSDILEHVHRLEPALLVIDSIQTIYSEESESSPGSVSQVRECASRLQMLAKTSGVSVFLIGHVTKEGAIAGPRVLEHIVDTVLYLEGDPFQAYRLLRSVKNRFGATSEVGVFEMVGTGMIEVPNPSEAFLAERALNAAGTAIAVTMEGTRPLLVEVQALTSPTSFSNPRRTPNGIDMNRLLLIGAVLSKRMGLKLFEQDIFVNVVGGMKIDEPASDLAMATAIASSYFDTPVPPDLALIGEIGLTGELRTVAQLPARLAEASKLGFTRAIVPKLRRKLLDVPEGLKLIEARNIGEALATAVPKK